MQIEACEKNILVDIADVDLTIRNIDGVYTKIRDALIEHEQVTLAVSENSAVDLGFIQLIESARLQARDLGKIICLAQPANANIQRVLERGGFVSQPSPETLRFWFHQEGTL